VRYPVAFRIAVGGLEIVLEPLLDDQENDTRPTTGAVYWEGAVRVSGNDGRGIGNGYLELTGYGEPLVL
jgi:predicted secreted hydrolase